MLDVLATAGAATQGNAVLLHHDIYSRHLGHDLTMRALKCPSLGDLFFLSGITCFGLSLFFLIWQG